MKYSITQTVFALTMVGLFGLSIGCQNSAEYEMKKPALEESLEEAGDAISDAAEDVADAVTPDREIVDVDTPIGGISVSEDPSTGDKKVSVGTEE